MTLNKSQVNKRLRKDIPQTNRMSFKPLGDTGAQFPAHERPKTIEWVQQGDLPQIQLLREILNELKKLNSK